MRDDTTDPRRQVILQAATQAFSAYGYRKTSMDDIARGAGMSRPALYLHYRNKEDIFRGLIELFYATNADALRAELFADPARSPQDTLSAAFRVQGGEVMELLMRSPHGRELFDASSQTSMDLLSEGEEMLTALYEEWLRAASDDGRVSLASPPEAVARTITAALKGMKYAAEDYDAYVGLIDALAALVGAGLAADRAGVASSTNS